MAGWRVYISNHPKYGRYYHRYYEPIERQQGWVTKAAVAAVLLVVIVPVLLLTLAALLVGVFVFVTLSLVSGTFRAIGSLFGGGGRGVSRQSEEEPGRENVRVIPDR